LKLLKCAADSLNAAGYQAGTISAYLTAGFPDQKLQWFEKAGQQLSDIGIKPYLSQYSPIPGTALGDRRLIQLCRTDTVESMLATNKILSVFSHPGWTADELQNLVTNWRHLLEV